MTLYIKSRHICCSLEVTSTWDEHRQMLTHHVCPVMWWETAKELWKEMGWDWVAWEKE